MSRACMLACKYAVEGLKLHLGEMHEKLDALRHEDPDAIHDIRVASRRLRAVLAEHAKLFDRKFAKKVRKHVRSVTQTLGQAREMDVSIAMIEAMRKKKGMAGDALDRALAFLKELRAQASPAIAEAVALIESGEFNQEMDRLITQSREARQCYFKNASKSTFALFSQVTEAHYDWQDEKSDPKLHALRIALKKFRYACEIYRDLYGREMKELIDQLKDAQEALGEWHDWFVLRDYILQAMPTAQLEMEDSRRQLLEKVDARLKKHLDEFARATNTFFLPAREEEILNFLVGG